MNTLLLDGPGTSREENSLQRGRVLLIAYSFPPVGGAGVQRPVKWVKYLQRAGWEVTVMTPSNPSVPVLDNSLLKEVAPETRLLRPATWEPGYATKQGLAQTADCPASWKQTATRWVKQGIRTAARLALQPDPQILWYYNALREATRLLKKVPHSAILCTAPPYSSFLIGKALKRRFRIPLILDYRDEWDLSSQYLEHAQRDRWSQWIQERQQRSVLRAADAIVATTQASLDHLSGRLNSLGHRARRLCLYNGFDPEDFPQPSGTSSSESIIHPRTDNRIRLVYTGTLWNLTDIAPLVTAMERLQQQAPSLAERFELVCVGRKTVEQQQHLARLSTTACRLIERDYCDHSESLKWLQSVDALVLLLSQVPGAERVVPAKLFEYLAARKDLLAIVPAGETSSLVSPFFPQGCCPPSDIDSIVNWLARVALDGVRPVSPQNSEAIEEFSRARQTERLSDLLSDLTVPRQGGRSPC